MTTREENFIARLDYTNSIAPDESGYQVFWPNHPGYLNAETLRVIADELDKRNKEWHEQVCEGYRGFQ